jgi:flagellar biosynthesis protein FlhA
MAESTEPPATGQGQAGLGSVDAELLRRFMAALRRGDIALALGVIGILVVLILPMPAWLLDFCLALSITLSVLILLVVLFIHRPLDFSAFPTVLLIATMLRLALNLASTRLILAHGHEGSAAAGRVIEAFGNFVMGGNYLIGMIVFAILVIVNFVVITKGAGRIAEVSARFSLDAMPGKQMAIDADLSAGLVNEVEARERRKTLEDESNFFGAMDGAAKFVRGDAIAGILITFINIIGGIIIATTQQGITVAEATQTYTLLTVGDGLVTQIPAIVVSTAAGMLVSKTGVAGSADKAVFGQLGGYPRALGLSGFLMLGLAMVPAIPAIPFLLLAGLTGGAAFQLSRRGIVEQARQETERVEQAAAAPAAEEPISAALAIDHIRLELGYGLLPLVNSETEQGLTDQIRGLRRQLAREMGFVMPAVRIQDNLQLPANRYVIRIKEIEAGQGELKPNMLLVMDPKGEKIALPGEETVEPTFGLPAAWIPEANREEALFRGHTVVDPATVVTTHLTELIRDNMAEILSFSETQKLLDEVQKTHDKLVSDVIPNQIAVGGVQRVLQGLLRERISVRDLPTILEGISEACGYTRNVSGIIEHVRARLARQLSDANANAEGVLPLVTLSPEWDQRFTESLVSQGEEKILSMAPSMLQEFIAGVRQTFERQAMLGENPILLTSAAVRPYVRSVIERFRPQTPVLSQSEIHPKARLKTVATI